MKHIQNITLKNIPQASKFIANRLKGGEVLALMGDLGSGKTAFVKALGKNLKIKSQITSPTFVLMNAFRAVLPKGRKRVLLVHLDLYRTRGIKEVRDLGLNEFWQKSDYITVIEWADKIKKYLPTQAWMLKFSHGKH
ncbi:MAG: tRNA (adenosine(37)-N6)-threonylcarbamoyltransferase complex ATPase subunit type 1 TsaE [Candidatus Doudnabacteria bacterium]|nr:tRNA (adenosine(37)-N6)-threonylcarbamoyltransferase complex ATPase subunit type 1 TsaE [Candidatus Doudnabacteria bacterium]